MSAPINYLNESEEEELGALIYKSSQTAKKFLDLDSSASASGGALSNTKQRAGPRPSADDCPSRNEGCKLIHESSFRYSLRSSSKKLKMKEEEATDESKCTGDNMLQQTLSQASEFKRASSDSESDNDVDSSDDEYLAKPSSSITLHTASKRYNLRRASHSRQVSNGATKPEPERISSADGTTPPSLSSTYCAVINEDGKSAEEMEGTYTDKKGREFVIKRIAGKKYKHYCKPEDVNKKNPRVILLCKHPGCTNERREGGVCVKHGAKMKRCKVEGCTSQSNANHLCCRHGAPRKMCKHKGCTNICKGAGGVCTRHGYKQRAIICKREGCQSQARKGGLCFKHSPSGYSKCKVEGCHKKAQAGGTCRGHAQSRQVSNGATKPEPERISSASTTPPSLSSSYCADEDEDGKSAEEMEGTYTDRKGREFVIKRIAGKKYKHYCKPEDVNKKVSGTILLCKHPDCTNESVRGWVCGKHGAKKKCCKVEGCTNQSQANHLCFRHGEKKICKHNDCTNIANRGGVCVKHGGKRRHNCKVEGCTNQSQLKQLCYRHGAPKKTCTHNEGCTNQQVKNHLCYRHGEKNICKHNGCTNIARARGVCKRHVSSV